MFGASLHDDVLADITAQRMAPLLGDGPATAASLAVRLGYVASLVGSFVLLLWPLRQVLADAVLGGGGSSSGGGSGSSGGGGGGGSGGGGAGALARRWWLPATAALIASEYAVAICLPSIWGALTLVGATATTVQSWLVPALLSLALLRAQRRRARGGGGGSGGGGGGWRGAAHAAAAGALLVVGGFMFVEAFVDAWQQRRALNAG